MVNMARHGTLPAEHRDANAALVRARRGALGLRQAYRNGFHHARTDAQREATADMLGRIRLVLADIDEARAALRG